MLYIIGLGLADEKDISVKGLEIVKKADRVYLEAYTAILLVEKSQLVRALQSINTLISINICSLVGSLLWPPHHPRRPRDGGIAKR